MKDIMLNKKNADEGIRRLADNYLVFRSLVIVVYMVVVASTVFRSNHVPSKEEITKTVECHYNIYTRTTKCYK